MRSTDDSIVFVHIYLKNFIIFSRIHLKLFTGLYIILMIQDISIEILLLNKINK
jgi:hypothetical protein